MCMIFYRRDTHIAEIQMGMPAVRLEDACTVDNFDVMKLPYVTLVGKLRFFLNVIRSVFFFFCRLYHSLQFENFLFSGKR